METLDYCNKSKLLERGWTESLIKKYLGDPDLTKPNPFYKVASPMKLYLLSRVSQAEQSDAFALDKTKSKKRSDIRKLVAQKQREQIMDYAENIQIKLPNLSETDAIRLACNNYNNYHCDYSDDHSMATPDSDIDFLRRITMNFIRHRCTHYEDELLKMEGKTGVQEAHDILQQRINFAIKEKYNW